jgi:hypothetical protein
MIVCGMVVDIIWDMTPMSDEVGISEELDMDKKTRIEMKKQKLIFKIFAIQTFVTIQC